MGHVAQREGSRGQQPETTAFIELYRNGGSRSENRTVDWRWVPYGEISSHLKRAVIVAEDARFFTHHGFATEEIKEAIARAIERGETPRGASISHAAACQESLALTDTQSTTQAQRSSAHDPSGGICPQAAAARDISQRGGVRDRNLRSGGGRTALFQQTGFTIERTRGGPASGILAEAKKLAPGS